MACVDVPHDLWQQVVAALEQARCFSPVFCSGRKARPQHMKTCARCWALYRIERTERLREDKLR